MKTLTLVNAVVYFVTLLAVQFTFSNFFGYGITVFCLAVATGCILVGISLAIFDGRILACTVLVAMTSLIVFQLQLFSLRTGYPIQWNIFFSYVPSMCFILFAHRKMNYDALFRALFYVSIIYSVLYIFAYNMVLNAEALPADEVGARVLVSDGTRDARVFLAATFPTFSFFYALTRIRKAKAFYGTALLISLTAMLLSQSRFHLATVTLVTLMYITGFATFKYRLMVFGVFMFTVLMILFGVVFSWNPLVVIQGDASGAARTVTFSVLQDFVSEHFILGVGLPSTRVDDALFTGRLAVFWDDVGVIGIWFVFGFLGVLGYCFLAGLCIIGTNPPERLIQRDNVDTLILSGLIIGIACVISPAVWLGSGTVIQGIAFGLFLRRYRKRVPGSGRRAEKPFQPFVPRRQRPLANEAPAFYGRR